MGMGHEFLIKKFVDDSGHAAAEFYTNRTAVHLMTEMLEAQTEGDRLMQLDVVLANPPYSIKQWDRDACSADPWEFNLYLRVSTYVLVRIFLFSIFWYGNLLLTIFR